LLNSQHDGILNSLCDCMPILPIKLVEYHQQSIGNKLFGMFTLMDWYSFMHSLTCTWSSMLRLSGINTIKTMCEWQAQKEPHQHNTHQHNTIQHLLRQMGGHSKHTPLVTQTVQ